jgi:ribosomal protein S18 acetylase RimI-like enzyme
VFPYRGAPAANSFQEARVTRSPVEARRANPGDLDELVLLWSQARGELGRQGRSLSPAPLEPFRARLLEALSSTETIILLGRSEGAAAGFAVLRHLPVLLADPAAIQVDQLFVIPSMRRRGVARAMLLLTASIAERLGAEQVFAGAPPSAREAHRFLARLGFSPVIVRRVTGTTVLRRRLAGEGHRRGLDDLLSRRRSLRARSLRAGWGEHPGDPGAAGAGDGGACPPSDAAGTAPCSGPGAPPPVVALPDGAHLDLTGFRAPGAELPGAGLPGAGLTGTELGAVTQGGEPARRGGRQRA